MARIDRKHQTRTSFNDSANVQSPQVGKKKAQAKQHLDPRQQVQATGQGRDLPSGGQHGQGSNATNVRLDNLVYKASPKHHGGVKQGGFISEAPVNGQAALDASVQIKATSPRRIAVDTDAQQFVVFDQTVAGEFHGHVRTWDQLSHEMQSVLRKQGVVNKKGKIQGGARCAIESPSHSPSPMRSRCSQATTPTWSAMRSFASCTARWIRSGSRRSCSKLAEVMTRAFAAPRRPAWATSPAFTAA